MAERRMFAKTIIDSDAFLDMPVTARLLYYDLGMRADDDGFVNSPKKITRMVGASQDDLSILIAKKFIIPFESGVVVIKHWKINNYIQNDRYTPTKYQDEMRLLTVQENKSYTTCIQDVYNMDTQVRLGKVRLGKDISGEKKTKFKKPTLEELKAYITENGYTVNAEKFYAYYEANGWMTGKTKMQDWQASVQYWQTNESKKSPDKFKNFDQRDYDVDAIEAMLLKGETK